MKTTKFFVEPAGDGFWAFQEKSIGKLPDASLHDVLNWILQQLNFGNCEIEEDQEGNAVTVILGKRAAPQLVSQEEVAEHAGKRLDAVAISGIIARCREEGTEPRFDKFVRTANMEASEWAHRNTELFYAFELNKLLRRISKKTFVFSSPPIQGKTSDRAIWYLGEATRCYLYRLHRACISLCRACLEESLMSRLGTAVWQKERIQERLRDPKKGDLEILIDVAIRLGYLDGYSREAHKIRIRGNDVMHRKTVKQEESWEILEKTRGIAEYLFSE